MTKMRKGLGLCLLLATLFLIGCKDSSTSVLLHHMSLIQQRGDSEPQRALDELCEIEIDIDNCRSEYVRNKYLLLRTRLRDKANLIASSPDTIESVVTYFREQGTDIERGEAYYYQGSVYRDLKDYPRAITSFRTTLDIAEESGLKPCRLLQNTYSQLAWIYGVQQIYDEAYKMAESGYLMTEKTETVDPIYIMDVASAAVLVGDTAEAISYSQKALEYIRQDSACQYPDVVCEMLILFSETGMRREVDECRSILDRADASKRAHNYLPAMETYYEQFSTEDSAMMYNKIILSESDNLSQKLKAAQRLMSYCFRKAAYEEGMRYALKYDEYVESTFEQNQYEQTGRACGAHLYTVSLQKEMQARELAARHLKKIYALVAALLLAALVGSLVYAQRKKRFARVLLSKDKELAQSGDVIRQYDTRLAEREAIVEEQKRKLTEMEREMEQAELKMKAMLKDKENIIREQQEKSKVLNRTIAENESVLMEKQREIKELVKLTLLEKASIDSGDVVQKFHDASTGKIVINDKDWRSLKTAVETMYPGFSAAAMSMKRNTELSIRTAFLLKIGMSNPEIASLTNSPRQTVWNRVEKVKKCMGTWLDVCV